MMQLPIFDKEFPNTPVVICDNIFLLPRKTQLVSGKKESVTIRLPDQTVVTIASGRGENVLRSLRLVVESDLENLLPVA